MIAGLPMYALPELATATADWWLGLRRHFQQAGLADLPMAIAKPQDLYEHWLKPDLLFTQTCGYPLTHDLANRVQLVATPCYSAPGCDGFTYRSVIVVRQAAGYAGPGDLRNKKVAFNSRDSQSGYNTLRHLIAPLAKGGRFFAAKIETGGHRHSLAAVRNGTADVAAIDCVSYALIATVAPQEVAGIQVLCRSESAPNLPYITAQTTTADVISRLREGLRAAIDDPHLATTRSDLLIADMAEVPISIYDRIMTMERSAMAAGYQDLD
ncbi:MAG: PhnD/SsuA/transferrin family substrate-binding protein [Dongiaceae bacterium]